MQHSGERNSVSEIFSLTVTCLTTKWMYVPISIALYVSFGMWLFVYIHPMAVFIVPTIVMIYALWLEDKRLTAVYEPHGHHADSNMQHLWTGHHLQLEKLMDEYIGLMEKREKDKEEPIS